MPHSDAEANRVLTLTVSDGGTWWVGLSLTEPTYDETTGLLSDVTDPDDPGLPLVALERDGSATWDVPATARHTQPLAALVLGDAETDFVPMARVFYADSAGTQPVRFARLTDVTVTAGSPVILPAASLGITDLPTL